MGYFGLAKLCTKIFACMYHISVNNGLIKVDLEFNYSIPGLYQTWNSNKPGFEKLNSRSEVEPSKKKAIIK